MKQPEISVGILSAKRISVELLGTFVHGNSQFEGAQTFEIDGNEIVWNGVKYAKIALTPVNDATFEVKDVVIGVNFHWERLENQRFNGSIEIIVEGDNLTLVNYVPVETYLASVISSEMSATACEEFLKAHAVISRSWLLAQIEGRNKHKDSCCHSSTVTDDEIVRWYDREDHVNFDVCADDHCQRYQGITRQTTPTVAAAIAASFGLVLTNKDGGLCDARFSKCCGGVFEEFENCWEPVHHHYLEARADSATPMAFPDLSTEEEARKWILGRPEAYCNTTDAEVLGQVLNNYDQETTDFYRWTVRYTAQELSALALRRSGIDFGTITALEPLERGTSGRITRLRITGTERTMVIGKELEIRRTLSPSHLYSSAFIVEKDGDSFVLHGAGWGHGVGLCQIGAAVMASEGKTFDEILAHYFPGSKLTTLYQS